MTRGSPSDWRATGLAAAARSGNMALTLFFRASWEGCMRLFIRLFAAACCAIAVFGAGPASAEKRVALVIGNAAYLHTSKLVNPKNDAADVAAALRKHGFEVVEALDLDKSAFDRKVRDF